MNKPRKTPLYERYKFTTILIIKRKILLKDKNSINIQVIGSMDEMGIKF